MFSFAKYMLTSFYHLTIFLSSMLEYLLAEQNLSHVKLINVNKDNTS